MRSSAAAFQAPPVHSSTGMKRVVGSAELVEMGPAIKARRAVATIAILPDPRKANRLTY
jgi:hypothetical protein